MAADASPYSGLSRYDSLIIVCPVDKRKTPNPIGPDASQNKRLPKNSEHAKLNARYDADKLLMNTEVKTLFFIAILPKSLSESLRTVTDKLTGTNVHSPYTNVVAARVYDTLCSIRSLSATIAINSLLVGFAFEILIV